MYGTLEGSLGQLTQIPHAAYTFLSKLAASMEQFVRGLSLISTQEHRQVRLDMTQAEPPRNIIDGDYLLQFLDLDE